MIGKNGGDPRVGALSYEIIALRGVNKKLIARNAQLIRENRRLKHELSVTNVACMNYKAQVEKLSKGGEE